METFHIEKCAPMSPSLCVCIMSGCVFLYLFPSTSGEFSLRIVEQGSDLLL